MFFLHTLRKLGRRVNETTAFRHQTLSNTVLIFLREDEQVSEHHHRPVFCCHREIHSPRKVKGKEFTGQDTRGRSYKDKEFYKSIQGFLQVHCWILLIHDQSKTPHDQLKNNHIYAHKYIHTYVYIYYGLMWISKILWQMKEVRHKRQCTEWFH